MLLNSFFLQNAALSHQTVFVVSQFGVTESILVTVGGPRCILDALEQFLSLREPQNAIFGGLWIPLTFKYRILRPSEGQKLL